MPPAATSKVILKLAAGLAAWWVFLFFVFLPGMQVPAGLLWCVGLVACFVVRDKETGFVLWFPTTAATIILLFKLLYIFCGEASLGQGSEPDRDPLAGLAALTMLVMTIAAFLLLGLCLWARPRRYSPMVCWLTVLNTAALGCVSYTRYDDAVGQEVQIHFLDSAGAPIEGAAVNYKVFGYGPGGSKPSSPIIARGPIASDHEGVVSLHSREGRHLLEASVQKPGYESLEVELGMQFHVEETSREVVIKIREKVLTRAHVSAKVPLKFMVYLPKPLEIDAPAQFAEVSTRSTRGDQIKNLDLLGTRFVDTPEADVHFDFFDEKDAQGYPRARLRLTALNGAGVIQVSYLSSLAAPLSSFENVMKIAPAGGYQDSTVLREPGNIPGPTIYVKARDGHTYARLEINAFYRSDQPNSEASVRIKLLKTSDASRALLFSKKSKSPFNW